MPAKFWCIPSSEVPDMFSQPTNGLRISRNSIALPPVRSNRHLRRGFEPAMGGRGGGRGGGVGSEGER